MRRRGVHNQVETHSDGINLDEVDEFFIITITGTIGDGRPDRDIVLTPSQLDRLLEGYARPVSRIPQVVRIEGESK